MSQITDKNFVIVVGGVQHQKLWNRSSASQSEGLKLKLMWLLSPPPTPILPSLHIFLIEPLSYSNLFRFEAPTVSGAELSTGFQSCWYYPFYEEIVLKTQIFCFLSQEGYIGCIPEWPDADEENPSVSEFMWVQRILSPPSNILKDAQFIKRNMNINNVIGSLGGGGVGIFCGACEHCSRTRSLLP